MISEIFFISRKNWFIWKFVYQLAITHRDETFFKNNITLKRLDNNIRWLYKNMKKYFFNANQESK